jgi:tRNA threonylcarbamoyladenosine biosynthesis protein TsaB
VLASVSAGRGHVFLQRFGSEVHRGPELVNLDDLDAWHHDGMICIGNHEAEIAATLGLRSGPAPFYPASAIARIAATRWQDNPPAPAPLYLRPADAAPARDAPPAILP